MLAIRLARKGRKKLPFYRVIVQEHHLAPSGKFVAQVGHYDPHTKEAVFDEKKVEEYLSNGARPSNAVAKLMKQQGITLPGWVKIVERKKAPKSQSEEPAEEAAPTDSAGAADKEEPAEEPAEKPQDEEGEDTPKSKPEPKKDKKPEADQQKSKDEKESAADKQSPAEKDSAKEQQKTEKNEKSNEKSAGQDKQAKEAKSKDT